MATRPEKKVAKFGRIGRRNPVARALIEQAMGGRVVPSRKRYTRKLKHPKRERPDD